MEIGRPKVLIRHYYPHKSLDGNCSSISQDCIFFTLRLSRISELYFSLVHLHTSIYRTFVFFHRSMTMRNWMLPSPHIFLVYPLSYVKCERTKGTYCLDMCTYVSTGHWQTYSQLLEQARQ